MKQPSIQSRLLATTTAVLVVFLALTAWVLDRTFYAAVITGAEEQLTQVIYSLMGSVDEDNGRLVFNDDLFEPRLSQPDSGLYAQVTTDLGELLWQSGSAVTTAVEIPQVESQPGTFVFGQSAHPSGQYHLSYMVFWEGVDTEQVTFAAATDQAPYRASINQFRRNLGVGLGAVTLVFVIAQLLALRWGLLPLRTMAEEVQQLEAGERSQLSAFYPRELEGLAGNLDRFVAHEERSRTRYRNALEDLAHSLKTPLAVMRNALLEQTPDKTLVEDQLDRMQTTVTHQLSKASARGPVVVGKVVDLGGMIQRLVTALQTAYHDRGIDVDLQLDQSCMALGDERDFMEVLGNLLENAFKYTTSKVRVSTPVSLEAEGVVVNIEDDGAGIPAALRQEVLNRGKRLDEMENGQGIGLAVVAELVDLYRGELSIGQSDLGGALISVRLPRSERP